mgnify:CR=1 FL=1
MLSDLVVAQAVESLRCVDSDGDVQAAVYMEMDEVSYEHEDWPWVEEDIQGMIKRVKAELG